MSQYYLTQQDYLMHHGVKGQKWGQRQYQNEDGSLTAAGREHYGYGEARSKMQSAKAKYKAAQKAYGKAFNKASGAGQYLRNLTKRGREENERRADTLVKTAKDAEKARLVYKDAKKEYKSSDEYKARQEKFKKAAIAGAAIVGTALVAYGAYKLSQANKTKAFEAAAKEGERKVRELTRSYESAKKSVEYAKSVGGGSGRNEHYKWNVDKNGYYSISQLSDREIAKDNATAAAKYNAEVAKEKYRNAKDGFYNVTYRKAVGYDPRKNK